MLLFIVYKTSLKMTAQTECAQEIFNLKIPGQQTQREKILWMQQNRMNGTWV